MSLFDTIRFIASHPLNRGRKCKSILRFAKWQIGSRLVPGSVACSWVNGSRFLARAGQTGVTGNIYTGLHEFSEMAFVLHFLRDTDLFVDVGANVGAYSILACAVIGANGYAFEPIPATFTRLVDNMRLNHLEAKIVCINKGVGAQPGTQAFTDDFDTTNHALAIGEQQQSAISVEVTTLDSELRDQSPKLIKIDVEGYETSVLEGASETLKNKSLSAVIIELNGSGERYGFDESKILQEMENYGFGTYTYSPLTRTLESLAGQRSMSGNTLFIRDKLFALERLRGAAKVSVHGALV